MGSNPTGGFFAVIDDDALSVALALTFPASQQCKLMCTPLLVPFSLRGKEHCAAPNQADVHTTFLASHRSEEHCAHQIKPDVYTTLVSFLLQGPEQRTRETKSNHICAPLSVLFFLRCTERCANQPNGARCVHHRFYRPYRPYCEAAKESTADQVRCVYYFWCRSFGKGLGNATCSCIHVWHV